MGSRRSRPTVQGRCLTAHQPRTAPHRLLGHVPRSWNLPDRRPPTTIATTLQVLNLELNGDLPSEELSSANAVPRRVAYVVSEVSRMLAGTPLRRALREGESAQKALQDAIREELQRL